MRTGRELVWFYMRPTLHAALVERADQHGHDLEAEILKILESATRPRGAQRGQLHLVYTQAPASTDQDEAGARGTDGLRTRRES